jgi:hypothetical protein
MARQRKTAEELRRRRQPRTPLQAARYRLSRDNTLEVVAAEVRRACAGHVKNGVREPCGFSAQQLSKHENGLKASREHIEALCRVYQRSAEELGLIVWERKAEPPGPTATESAGGTAITADGPGPGLPRRRGSEDDGLTAAATRVLSARDPEEADQMERRTFGKGIGVALGASAADPVITLARRARALLGASEVSASRLASMERAVQRYVRTWPGARADASIEDYALALVDDWASVGSLFEAQMTASNARRLNRVYGQLSGVLGLLAFELCQYRRASELYQTAQDAARQAADADLLGWLFAAESLVPFFSGDPSGTVDLAEQGLRAVGRGQTMTAAWLHAQAARAHGELAATDPAHVRLVTMHVEEARAILDRATAGAWDGNGGIPQPFAFDTDRLIYLAGSAHIAAGDVKRGGRLCEEASTLLAKATVKDYSAVAMNAVNLAAVELAGGEPAGAATTAGGALEAYTGHNRNVLRRMGAFEAALAPHRELPAVRDFSGLLHERRRSMRSLPSA